MSIKVNNFMEICVLEFLEDILEHHPDVCKCKNCREDIAAYALNQLQPKYTTTDLGHLYSKAATLDSQRRTDIFRAIAQGIQCVKDKPRHP
ncbi:MAG: late competence development ComFB family protein [Clostridia bacterium]|nr:late competence development ComFB family protein [Clostridia bacterium]